MSRIYVASPMVAIERARSMATWLDDRGFTIASRWHAGEGKPRPESELTADALATIGDQNIDDLWHADAVVVLTQEGAGRETYVEIGIAVAWKRPIVWSLEHGGRCLSAAREGVLTVDYDSMVPEALRFLVPAAKRRAPALAIAHAP